MTKILFILIFLCLHSCSSKNNSSTLKNLLSHQDAKIKKIPVSDRGQAEKVINIRLQFLKLLFEQSIDPYYNTPKWTPACLAENKIGEVEKFSNGAQLVSELYINLVDQTGFCSSNVTARKAKVIYVYCEPSAEVIEITLPLVNFSDKVEGNLCQ